MKTIALCPLVSRDIVRAIRSTVSAQEQYPTSQFKFVAHPVINSRNNEFIRDFSEWCEKHNIRYSVTESNGTPSKGKNELLRMLRNSDYYGVSLMDGDDFFYPVAAQQIERHLKHHGSADLIINKPMDRLFSRQVDRSVFLAPGQHGLLWGISEFKLSYNYGPGVHAIFEQGHSASTNLGHHTYYSRKVAELLRYDEDQLLGEDFLFEFYAMKQHQNGNLDFWCSMVSDIGVLDRTSDNQSIQNEHNDNKGRECFERLLKIAPTVVPQWRSSFDELPVQFAPLLMTHTQKVEFLKEFLRRDFRP